MKRISNYIRGLLIGMSIISACEERVNPERSWDRCRSSGINEFICIFHPIGDLISEPIRLMSE